MKSKSAGASILVADDESEARDYFRDALTRAGHSVTTTENGATAIEELRRADYDVIISDVNMPEVDGLGLLAAVKERSADTEVIMATGFGTMDTAIKALRLGAFDFIVKPLERCTLLAAVERAIEHRALHSTAALFQASQVIFANRDPQRLPEVIVETAMKVMGADDVSLMLLDADDKLYIACSHGLAPEIRSQVRIAVGERVAGRVAASRRPLLLPGRLAEHALTADLTPLQDVGSSIIHPLVAGERLVGVLNLSRARNRRPFGSRDFERAAVIASQILLALENVQLIRRLVGADRLVALGQLAAGVAHEIRNPLSCVVANHAHLADRIEQLGARSDELREVLADLDHATARILDIVRDLATLGRSDETTPPIRFDVKDALSSALRICAARLRDRATVELDLASGLCVVGNPGRLSQVFVNLLLNAADAFADKLGKHEIAVSARLQGERVIVAVADNGSGIAPEHLGRIFEPFFTTKRPGAGTGLGLPISRDIVARHGGEMRVESTLGVGTTFSILLPAAAAGSEATSDDRGRQRPRPTT